MAFSPGDRPANCGGGRESPAAAQCVERRAGPLWSRMRAALDPESQGNQEPAPRRAQQQAAILGAANPGRGHTGGVSESGRPKGPTPRHNAPRPMPVTMPGTRRRPRPRRSGDRGIFDRGALLRLLDALWHSGDHTRQPQLTQPDRLPGARFGLLRSSTEIRRENIAIEFSHITRKPKSVLRRRSRCIEANVTIPINVDSKADARPEIVVVNVNVLNAAVLELHFSGTGNWWCSLPKSDSTYGMSPMPFEFPDDQNGVARADQRGAGA
jgi:hypothetical protein